MFFVALLLILKYTRPYFTTRFSQNDKEDLNNNYYYDKREKDPKFQN